MRRNRSIHHGCLLFLLLIGFADVLRAEIICQEPNAAEDRDCRYLLLSDTPTTITEEPDPLGAGSEGPAATTPGGVIPDDASTEGAPQVVTGHGMTVAVWVEVTSGNRDIVFSQWRPGGWHEERLTVGGSDEVGPSVSIGSDGAVYVAWWEIDEPRQIRVARRDPATSLWHQPAVLSGMHGSRPSVLTLPAGGVLIAFERRVWGGGKDIVIRRAGTEPGGPVDDVLASTPRDGTLAVQLHRHGDRVYVDWIHTSHYYGYSEFSNGTWGASLDSRPFTQRAGSQQVRVEVLPVFP